MADTLGSLCDKLTIIKLKQWHSEDAEKLKSLEQQELQLSTEINDFIKKALSGEIAVDKLTFSSNKVFKAEGNDVGFIVGDVGSLIAQLAHINCELWHEQEKVYEFEKIPVEEKDVVVKKLAILNLKRNKCMDEIDQQFKKKVIEKDA
jgi:hypothetical protein